MFKPVKRSDLPPNSNILSSRFVLAIKDVNTPAEKYKSRLVIHGHRDSDRKNLFNNSPSLRLPSLRMMLIIAAICKFKLWSLDITQAFIQSKNISWLVYLIPPA